MPATLAADVVTHEVFGSQLRFVASPANGAVETGLLRCHVPAGGVFPAHSHDREEIIYFLAGDGAYTVDGQDGAFGAGDVVVIPADLVHEFRIGSAVDCIAVSPAGTKMFAPDGSEIVLG